MKQEVEKLIEQGYISKKRHPFEDIYILNYTAKTQYERLWNEVTIQCRGLIVDKDYKIKARCFNKFFNYEEVKEEVDKRVLNNNDFSLTEKIDGSLGILYWIKNTPYIATRGSFESDQAIKANQILSKSNTDSLDKDLTYLFEIIYPENKICVNYGQEEKLVLLAAFDTETGTEVSPEVPFEKTKEHKLGSDFSKIKELNIPNREGFVVRFSDGYRFKIKFEDYVKLHSVIFSISSRSVWDCLRNDVEIITDKVPDEIYNWIRLTKNNLIQNFKNIENESNILFGQVSHLPRKKIAELVSETRCSPIIFKMLDRKPYKDIIWKMIEPEYRTPKHEEI